MSKFLAVLKQAAMYAKTHKKQLGIAAGGLLIFLYGLAFLIPKPVQFSYGGDTCVNQLTLFPALHKAVDESKLGVSFGDEVKLGSVALAATKTCFTAKSEPKSGDIAVATAPFGGMIARKSFVVHVPSAPVANVTSFDKPLPVSKPLEITLSQPDATFSYQLEHETAQAPCENSGQAVSCDVPMLKLEQGKEYALKLTRHFKGSGKTTLVDKSVKTLKAVTIKKASLKNGQTVYAKPTSFTFTTDKPLKKADATLLSEGKPLKDITITAEVSGETLVAKLSKQLPREAKYQLVLKQAEAIDGSTLLEPEKINFEMSGGPKVKSVSIGTSRVATSAVATIQFDQKLGNADIKKYVSLKGGNATISKNGSSATVALKDLPLCKAFSLDIASSLPSKYGIKSKTPWKFDSRTICHAVSTYGTSVQGRPLTAYIFGNSGPVTMYVGAIHGNESSSSGLLKSWVNHLEANPSLLDGKRVVVVPSINPDGLAANTRTNSRGVNLNRNFPTSNWQRDIDDTDGKHKNGGGTKALSEPEAKALASLTQQYKPRLLLSFHAVGSLVQGDSGSPSASYAAKYASLVGYSNATGQGDTFDYGITGGYEDWAWRNIGVPSMVIELGSYSYFDFGHHKNALETML